MKLHSKLATCVAALVVVAATAYAVSPEDLEALLAEQRQAQEALDQMLAQQEQTASTGVRAESIDASSLYADLDRYHLYLRELNLKIQIAEAEKRLEELSGDQGGTGAIRHAAEISALTLQMQQLESRIEDNNFINHIAAQAAPVPTAAAATEQPNHKDWFVARLTVSENTQWVVINDGRSLSGRLTPGDSLDGVTIVSIEPGKVVARHGNTRFDIPMRQSLRVAAASASGQGVPQEQSQPPRQSIRESEAEFLASQQHMHVDAEGNVTRLSNDARDSTTQ